MSTNEVDMYSRSDKRLVIQEVSSRQIALIAGALYLLTFVSIPTIGLYASIHDSNYAINFESNFHTLIGAILELIVAFACVGTGVVLYPILKKHNEELAMGFVAARVLEAAIIFVGIACVLSVLNLRKTAADTETLAMAQILVTLYDNLFLLGQGIMPAVNALLLGTLLYRSRLVPRPLPLLALIGAPLLLASHAAVMFGFIERVSNVSAVAALPIGLWEFSLGIWLVSKGFKSSVRNYS
jgi:hypothetical protein